MLKQMPQNHLLLRTPLLLMAGLQLLRLSLEFCKSQPVQQSYLLTFGLLSFSPDSCSGATPATPSLGPQQNILMALTMQSKVSMTMMPASPKRSRSLSVIQMGLQVKMKQSVMKAPSPRKKITLSMHLQRNSPRIRYKTEQTPSTMKMQLRYLVSRKVVYRAARMPVLTSLMYISHSIHFLSGGVSSVWMHLQPISWKKGKMLSPPKMIAGAITWFISRVALLFSAIIQCEVAYIRGRQNHLMNPFRALKTGSNSILLLQHFWRLTKMKQATSSARKQAPKVSGKPLEQMKSPSLQKRRRFLLKATMEVVRWLLKEVGAMVMAKRQHIWRKSSPRKQCLKKRRTRGVTESAQMDMTTAASWQVRTTGMVGSLQQ